MKNKGELTPDNVISGNGISYHEAMKYITLENFNEIQTLMNLAGAVTNQLHGTSADLCEIINAKSGLCAENCSFCAQSLKHASVVDRFPLVDAATILARAELAQSHGAKEFCVVTSGGSLRENELKQLLETIQILRARLKIQIGVSVGFLNRSQAERIKKAGVRRVNHNLQTSSDYYSKIATTHTYTDRKNTLKALREADLEICCGVILGLGESREDRVRAAFEIKEYEPESVPINLLDPRPGTPLEGSDVMSPIEILKTLAVFRLVLPKTCLKLAGGRHLQLNHHQIAAFKAGVNGLIIGEYLTTENNNLQEDYRRLDDAGLDW